DSADRNGAPRLRRSEDCRGDPEAEAELLSREPPLQQLVVYAEGGAAPRVGLPGALGDQAHRRARYGDARPRTDEPAECARLADVARFVSCAHRGRSPDSSRPREYSCRWPNESPDRARPARSPLHARLIAQ